MDNRYSARSLSLRLGNRQIIHDVSLQLCGGGMTALIGPNGAGKSTLLRLLTGYLTPDGGVRVVEGRPLESWSAETLSRRRAVMLQRTQLHADWPVETVIAMGRSPWGGVANEAMIRRVMGFGAYAEGWALYSEQVVQEMGLYKGEPLNELGYIHDALLRSARLVTDSGLHHLRWTREKAIAEMRAIDFVKRLLPNRSHARIRDCRGYRLDQGMGRRRGR